jgi:GNAT superfamily N-acetyltransferase
MKFRKAIREDVPFIVQMIANDKLGQSRENYSDPLPDQYYDAFEKISANPNQELIVVENDQHEIIGTLHLTFLQYLTYQGGIRAQIEAVRVREDLRGEGIGQKMFEWAINRARERNAHLLQLTTDKQRPEAIRFYEKLGFKASHEGMKIHLKKE